MRTNWTYMGQICSALASMCRPLLGTKQYRLDWILNNCCVCLVIYFNRNIWTSTALQFSQTLTHLDIAQKQMTDHLQTHTELLKQVIHYISLLASMFRSTVEGSHDSIWIEQWIKLRPEFQFWQRFKIKKMWIWINTIFIGCIIIIITTTSRPNGFGVKRLAQRPILVASSILETIDFLTNSSGQSY